MKYLTQQKQILALLKLGKVNSYELTYKYSIKQGPTRVKELREQGYNILSQNKTDRSVDYYLSDSPIAKTTGLKTQPERANLASKRIQYYTDAQGRSFARIV